MSDQPRPVWLTREQRDLLAVVAADGLYDVSGPRFSEMSAAWDAAPADPAEAVRVALAAASYTAGAGPVALAALKAPRGYGIPGDFDRKVAR